MAPVDARFITSILNADRTNVNLAELVEEFHTAEAASDGPHVQRIPYFRWQNSLSAKQTMEIQSEVQTACDRDNNAPETLVAAAGILMRLSSEQPVAIQLLTPLLPQLLKTCRSQTILFELGNIFRALPNWPLLQRIARAALDTFSSRQWQTNIICDWLMLANYRLLVKKFEVNALSAGDINLFEIDIDRLAKKIGENTKNIAFYRGLKVTLDNRIEEAITWMLKAQQLPGKILVLF